MSGWQSAVIVTVPAVEPAVADLRAQLDRAAGWGVPAHVTVLFPFLAPDLIDGDALARLGRAVAQVPRFDVSFDHVEWFGETVLWLAPEPADPFRELTSLVWQAFPDTPPYGGEYPDTVPHLTVGHDAGLDTLRAAADTVRPRLPVRGPVDAVQVFIGSPGAGYWHSIAELPLG